MFKHWLINIATSGMTKEQKKEVEEAVENSEEVENMRYNLERAITSEFEKIENKLKDATEKALRVAEKGATEKAIKVAENFLRMGLEVEQVAKGSELPIEKILELKKKMLH